MSKNKNLTPEVEAFIAEWYYSHPKWSASQIQCRVSQMLHIKNPNQCPEGWPGISAVRKVLTEVKKKNSGLNPEDEPWSMAILDYAPISPEAIPAVLNVWKYRVAREENFTIRESKWVARLSYAIKEKEDLYPRNLSSVSTQYARMELIYHLIGRPFNTMLLDKQIMAIPHLITSKDGLDCLLPLLARQEDAISQIQERKKGKRDGITIGDPDYVEPERTKEQILEKADKIRKGILEEQKRWEDYKKEANSNEGTYNQEG